MAFFNNDSLFGYSGGVACAEGYDVDFGGYARIVEESCMDQLEIVKAMHSVDMQELNAAYKVRAIRESAGDEDDVDDAIEEFETAKEGVIKDAFNKIKEALKKFFSKVFGWIKSIWDKLVTFKKSNKSFAETYRPVVEEYEDYIKSVEYTGFDYDLAKLDATMKAMSDDMLEIEKKLLKNNIEYVNGFDKVIDSAKANKFKEAATLSKDAKEEHKKKTDEYETERKNIMKDIDPDNNGMSKDSKEFFRGSRGTQKYSASDIVKSLDVLETLDLKQIKKFESESKKAFADAESTIKAAEAKYKKVPVSDAKGVQGNAFNSIRNECIKAANETLSQTTTLRKNQMRAITVYRECVIDFSNQIKHVTIKAIAEGKAAKKKADAKND